MTLAMLASLGAALRNSSLSHTSKRLPGLPRPFAKRSMPCRWPVYSCDRTIQALSGFLLAIDTPLPSDETCVACLPVGPSGFGKTSISNGSGRLAIWPGQADAAKLVVITMPIFWLWNSSWRLLVDIGLPRDRPRPTCTGRPATLSAGLGLGRVEQALLAVGVEQRRRRTRAGSRPCPRWPSRR